MEACLLGPVGLHGVLTGYFLLDLDALHRCFLALEASLLSVYRLLRDQLHGHILRLTRIHLDVLRRLEAPLEILLAMLIYRPLVALRGDSVHPDFPLL